MANEDNPEIFCAERIALLHLLHSNPVPPSTNDPIVASHSLSRHVLPFETERQLASTIAFLTNSDDDPDHVPAVCLQESSSGQSLHILISVNKATYADGDKVLREMQSGLKKLFDLMSSIEQGTFDVTLDNVFAAIVARNQQRILRRLRFVENRRGKAKPLIHVLLQRSVDSVKMLQSIPAAAISRYSDLTSELIRLIQAWHTHQTLSRLGDVVAGFYTFSKMPGLVMLLDAIPNTSMDPDCRKGLLNAIRKIGRYRGVAGFLCRKVIEQSILRRVDVVSVKLPASCFERSATSSYIPNLSEAISPALKHTGRHKLNEVFKLLGTTEALASEHFAAQVQRSQKKSKVHAEIQLLFHCQLEHSEPAPRVISSSKDACFLCNAFVLMHGKYHIPKQHGRLYPGWRLPLSTHLRSEQRAFNELLQQHIQRSLAILCARRTKTVYPDPNESTLLTLPGSAADFEDQNMREGLACDRRGPGDGATLLGVPSPLVALNGILVSGKSRDTPFDDASQSSEHDLRVSTSGAALPLDWGEAFSFHINSGESRKVEANGLLDIYVERSLRSRPESPPNDRAGIVCRMEWPTDAESKCYSKLEVVDADCLYEEALFDAAEPNGLMLRVNDSMIRLSVSLLPLGTTDR